jgi:hypothetical protein
MNVTRQKTNELYGETHTVLEGKDARAEINKEVHAEIRRRTILKPRSLFKNRIASPSAVLEMPTGQPSRQAQVRAFSVAVIEGHWEDAEPSLFHLVNTLRLPNKEGKEFSEIYNLSGLETSDSVLCAFWRHHFLELLEEKRHSQAVALLQSRLKPMLEMTCLNELHRLSL